MKKGEETKERIIEQTAPLFNKMGFFGSSLSDVMRATGLKKGGIYNHFESKEDLAMQAFDHAALCASQKIVAAIASMETAEDKLYAFADVFVDNYANPPIAGGCPLFNTAVSSSNAHPALRQKAREAMDRWRTRIRDVVLVGIGHGEIKADVEPEEVATCLIATLEGGLLLSRLYQDPIHVQHARNCVLRYIRQLLLT